jgi:hypothetical protein
VEKMNAGGAWRGRVGMKCLEVVLLDASPRTYFPLILLLFLLF